MAQHPTTSRKSQIQHLQERAWMGSEERGFHDHTFGEEIALIHSEASEALEEYRKDGEEAFTEHYDGDKPIGVPSELADIVIRVLDCAASHGIDLEDAILKKMAYNDTRSYRHGGKHL